MNKPFFIVLLSIVGTLAAVLAGAAPYVFSTLAATNAGASGSGVSYKLVPRILATHPATIRIQADGVSALDGQVAVMKPWMDDAVFFSGMFAALALFFVSSAYIKALKEQ